MMNAAGTDFYAVLGLTPHATQAQLRHAYRTLLRQHHPDTRVAEQGQSVASVDAALQEVLTAYEALRDPARRADYDRLRTITAPRSTRQNIRIHPRHNDLNITPPIQAGPVHWLSQPEP
jgi:curved DNA-binding protein CbpA